MHPQCADEDEDEDEDDDDDDEDEDDEDDSPPRPRRRGECLGALSWGLLGVCRPVAGHAAAAFAPLLLCLCRPSRGPADPHSNRQPA